MHLVFEIASKFLFGKKTKGIINVISTISIIGVGVGTTALLIVLSVFNGLHGLIGDLFGSFDPEIKVMLNEGKFFSTDSANIQKLNQISAIDYVVPVIEDNALLKYKNRQVTGVIMGVDSNYVKVSQLDSIIYEGKFQLRDKNAYTGVIGYVLADQLNIHTNFVTPLMIYVPERNKKINFMRPNEAFKSHYIQPKGIFLVKQMDYDSQYLLIDIDLARKLLQYKSNEVTSLSISLKNGSSVSDAQKQIKNILGPHFKVLNRQEQHANFYKMMRIEKIMAYLILCFILVIATFNLIGTMSMLIFDKKEHIQTLKAIGANQQMVTRIFLIEGWLISLIGVFSGLILGVVLVLVQEHLGVIQFSGSGNFVVDAYPVALEISDVFISLITVLSIGFIATLYPVKVIVKRYFNHIEN